MHRAYSNDISDNLIRPDEEESAHIVRVLRMAVGDRLEVTDGRGNLYTCVLEVAGKKEVIARILSTEFIAQTQPQLTLAIAPTKNADRLEWLAEKAVEMGISCIVPLLCRHSERKQFRADRLGKILLSAMKQSQRVRLPELRPMVEFADFVREEYSGQKAIAHCREGQKENYSDFLKKGKDALVLIGPEGDFSTEEVDMAVRAGFVPVSLGSARLRTETAGLAVCAGFYLSCEG